MGSVYKKEFKEQKSSAYELEEYGRKDTGFG